MTMEAIVLAGGLGTRLKPAVPDLPKALAPINGKPFLTYLLDHLQREGIARVVLSVGYCGEMIRSCYGPSYCGMPIAYCAEERPLGTGGAILRSFEAIKEDRALILNGDTFFPVPYREMFRLAESQPEAIVMGLSETTDRRRYGGVDINHGRVTSFVPKGVDSPGLISAGVYVVPRHVLETLRVPCVFSWETEFLQRRVNELSLLAYVSQVPFIDIGTPESYREGASILV